jgi:hypothetical protein
MAGGVVAVAAAESAKPISTPKPLHASTVMELVPAEMDPAMFRSVARNVIAALLVDTVIPVATVIEPGARAEHKPLAWTVRVPLEVTDVWKLTFPRAIIATEEAVTDEAAVWNVIDAAAEREAANEIEANPVSEAPFTSKVAVLVPPRASVPDAELNNASSAAERLRPAPVSPTRIVGAADAEGWIETRAERPDKAPFSTMSAAVMVSAVTAALATLMLADAATVSVPAPLLSLSAAMRAAPEPCTETRALIVTPLFADMAPGAVHSRSLFVVVDRVSKVAADRAAFAARLISNKGELKGFAPAESPVRERAPTVVVTAPLTANPPLALAVRVGNERDQDPEKVSAPEAAVMLTPLCPQVEKSCDVTSTTDAAPPATKAKEPQMKRCSCCLVMAMSAEEVVEPPISIALAAQDVMVTVPAPADMTPRPLSAPPRRLTAVGEETDAPSPMVSRSGASHAALDRRVTAPLVLEMSTLPTVRAAEAISDSAPRTRTLALTSRLEPALIVSANELTFPVASIGCVMVMGPEAMINTSAELSAATMPAAESA